MELKPYCDSLSMELTAWKAKIYDTVRRFDKMDTGDKQKVVPQINELHMIVEEMDDRIGRLRDECPAQWEPEKFALEGDLTRLKAKWEQTEEMMAP